MFLKHQFQRMFDVPKPRTQGVSTLSHDTPNHCTVPKMFGCLKPHDVIQVRTSKMERNQSKASKVSCPNITLSKEFSVSFESDNLPRFAIHFPKSNTGLSKTIGCPTAPWLVCFGHRNCKEDPPFLLINPPWNPKDLRIDCLGCGWVPVAGINSGTPAPQ